MTVTSPAAASLRMDKTPLPTQWSDTTVAIEPSAASINPGEEFELAITIQTDAQTRGIQFELIFDPNLVELYDGYQEGDFYRNWASSAGATTIVIPQPVIDNTAGKVSLSAVAILGAAPGAGGATGSGEILTLRGKAKDGTNGTAIFKLNQVIVSDAGDPIEGYTTALGGVKVQDGAIGIGGGVLETPQTREVTPMGIEMAPTWTPEPTIARRASLENSSGNENGGIPWEIILPLSGAIVIGLGAFIFMRKSKS